MEDFTGKVAAITGAGSGIGRALALQLAEAGAPLALSDISEAGLTETRKQALALALAEQQVTTHVVDVAEREQVERFAAEVVARHGKVNVLINNAGVALGSDIASASYEDLHWLMNINFWGVVNGCKSFLPALIESGDGHITNISSIFGLMAVPSQGIYNASKFAVRGFSEALRLELRDQPVNVSTAFPAGIQTNIVQSARRNVEDEADFEAQMKKTEHMFNNTAERAASDILKGMQANKARIMVGKGARRVDWATRLAPLFTSNRALQMFLKTR